MNYLILSLKHSEGNKPVFWKSDNAGYTFYLTAAGVYSDDDILKDPKYYNNGRDTLAIPLTVEGFESIGLSVTIDVNRVLSLASKREKEVSNV